MEESSFQTPINQFSYSSPQAQKKSSKFIYLVIFLVIIGGFFLVKNLFFKSETEKQTANITPAPTEYQFPTDAPMVSTAPTPQPSPSVKPSVTPADKEVDPIDQSTGLDRSTLSVEVQNGSGEVGVAAKGAEALKDFGYEIGSTGNADNYDYQGVTIKVKSTKANFLPLLKKDLGFSYTVNSFSSDLPSDYTADALVIIGK